MNPTYYVNSKGEEIDPTTMAYPHLQSALAKAIREGHADNEKVLGDEVARREAEGEQQQ